MQNTTSTHVFWKPMVVLWLGLAMGLAMVPVAPATETEGEDCDEIWSHTEGPLRRSEKCEYILGPAGPGELDLPEGSVTQDLRQPCPGAAVPPRHRLRFRFSIDPSELNTSFGDRFGIFELWDDGTATPEKIVYLEIIDKGIVESKWNLVLNWHADDSDSGQETPTVIVDPELSIVEVEWVRSFDGNGDGEPDDNGVIRLFLNDLLIAEVTGLRFEDDLPATVSYGAFDALGTGIEGDFMFQPLEFSTRYFRNQGPVPGLP